MKPLALVGIYATSLGAISFGIGQGYFPESWFGPLLLVWATAGLVFVWVGIWMGAAPRGGFHDDES